MRTPTRLIVYATAVAVLSGGAYVVADAVVPQVTVDRWIQSSQPHESSHLAEEQGPAPDDSRGNDPPPVPATEVPGVTSAAAGFLLTPILAPGVAGKEDTLTFRILGTSGEVITRFVTSHQKKLHLIVVRTDGGHFRHVHPTMSRNGTWSLPWTWRAAGTYRVYVDFVPEDSGSGEAVTLTRTVEVAGRFVPRRPQLSDVASVDDLTVRLKGQLAAGGDSALALTVSRAGEPVRDLEPYLGAFGHLVALREGDLAYLHVHPQGEEPREGSRSGPDVRFVAEAPTAGRYLLYLDFKVDGAVKSASFVVDSTTGGETAPNGPDEPGEQPGDGHDH